MIAHIQQRSLLFSANFQQYFPKSLHLSEILCNVNEISCYFIKSSILIDKYFQILNVCYVSWVLKNGKNLFKSLHHIKYLQPPPKAKFQFFIFLYQCIVLYQMVVM